MIAQKLPATFTLRKTLYRYTKPSHTAPRRIPRIVIVSLAIGMAFLGLTLANNATYEQNRCITYSCNQ